MKSTISERTIFRKIREEKAESSTQVFMAWILYTCPRAVVVLQHCSRHAFCSSSCITCMNLTYSTSTIIILVCPPETELVLLCLRSFKCEYQLQRQDTKSSSRQDFQQIMERIPSLCFYATNLRPTHSSNGFCLFTPHSSSQIQQQTESWHTCRFIINLTETPAEGSAKHHTVGQLLPNQASVSCKCCTSVLLFLEVPFIRARLEIRRLPFYSGSLLSAEFLPLYWRRRRGRRRMSGKRQLGLWRTAAEQSLFLTWCLDLLIPASGFPWLTTGLSGTTQET